MLAKRQSKWMNSIIYIHTENIRQTFFSSSIFYNVFVVVVLWCEQSLSVFPPKSASSPQPTTPTSIFLLIFFSLSLLKPKTIVLTLERSHSFFRWHRDSTVIYTFQWFVSSYHIFCFNIFIIFHGASFRWLVEAVAVFIAVKIAEKRHVHTYKRLSDNPMI